MPHALPSDIVTFIDRAFPTSAAESEGASPHSTGDSNRGAIASFEVLLELTDQVPDRLLTLDSTSFVALVAARAAIRSAVTEYRNWPAQNRTSSAFVPPVPSFGRVPAVAIIRRELAKCPDQAPPPAESGLEFISDSSYKDALRLDISTVTSALAHDEWKAATVISGSVIEALLLWALEQRSGDLATAINALEEKGEYKPPRKKPDLRRLENWDLNEFIPVAQELKEIDECTATFADQVRGFRNLIHPGRSERLKQKCTRGTAQACHSTLLLVIEDLEKRHQ